MSVAVIGMISASASACRRELTRGGGAGSAAMAAPGRRAWVPPWPVRGGCGERAACLRRRRPPLTASAPASAAISTQAAITAPRSTDPARIPMPVVRCAAAWWVAGPAAGAGRAGGAVGAGARCAAAMAAAAVTAAAASRAP